MAQRSTVHRRDVAVVDRQGSFLQARFIAQPVLVQDLLALSEEENEMCGREVIEFRASFLGLLLSQAQLEKAGIRL
jgi:hypothetical protein